MRLSEIMTSAVVTTSADNSVLRVAGRMTQDMIEGALPQFYFHERG